MVQILIQMGLMFIGQAAGASAAGALGLTGLGAGFVKAVGALGASTGSAVHFLSDQPDAASSNDRDTANEPAEYHPSRQRGTRLR